MTDNVTVFQFVVGLLMFCVLLWTALELGKLNHRAALKEYFRRELPEFTALNRPRYLVLAGTYQQFRFHARDLLQEYGPREVRYLGSYAQLHGYGGEGATRVLLLGEWWKSPVLESDREWVWHLLTRIDPDLSPHPSMS